MAKGTPQQGAEKWQRNTKAGVPDYRAGIERVTEAPGVKAAAQSDKWIAKIQEAHRNGKWERRVASVPLQEWKNAAINKGANNIAAGVDNSVGKMQNFLGEIYPHIDQIQSELASMPSVSLEDGIARATHNIRRMAEFKRGNR